MAVEEGNAVPVRDTGLRKLIALGMFVAICFAISAISGAITATSVATWYPQLTKPAFNPPDWVFAPVWTSLYLMIAISGWRIWLQPESPARAIAMRVYAVQLCTNLGWSAAFFGITSVLAGLIVMPVLLAVVLLNLLAFWRIDRWAGLLLTPYLAWVGFAAVLNTAIWLLNPQ